MWTTSDGYALTLPRSVLRELAARAGAPEDQVMNEVGRLASSARRLGSFRARATGRTYPVFRADSGARAVRLVTRPIGGARSWPGPRGPHWPWAPGYSIVGVSSRFADPRDDDPALPDAAAIDERAPRGGGGRSLIIDGHCHAGAGDGLTGPWDTSAPLAAYLRRAARAGIDRTVIFAPFHSDYRAANRGVAALVAARPGRLLGFAFVDPARDRGRVEAMLAEAVEVHGFVGVKVHRHDGRITREVCEAARRRALPVLYDVMGEVHVVELIAAEYPDVAFIIPHLGSFADDWKAQLALVDVLARRPNVFTDTAGVRRFDMLEQAVRRAGAAKVIFGSDGPWLHPGVELAKVRALGLPPGEERLVLGGNLGGLIQRAQSLASRQGASPAPLGLQRWGDGRHEMR